MSQREIGRGSGGVRVVVVGPCASGKSTLVQRLRQVGVDAYACAQEHSGIPWLFRHLQPDVIIALRVDLATVRERRGSEWPEAIFWAQMERLRDAYASADLVIDTATSSPDQSLAQALEAISDARPRHR